RLAGAVGRARPRARMVEGHGSVVADRLDVEEITRVDGRITEPDDEGGVRIRPDTLGVLRVLRQRDALARGEVDPPDGQRLQRPKLESGWSAQLVDVLVQAAVHELAERLRVPGVD